MARDTAATLPYFQFFPQAWFFGTRTMSPTARGVYIDMLAVQWMQGPLPDDREAVGLLIGCTVSDGDWAVVRSKFRPDGNGHLTNEKLDEVLRDAAEKGDLYASAGRAGGKKRAENAKSKPPSSHPQATLEPPLRQPQATLERKRRVEESRGEKTRGAVNPPLEDPAPLSSSTTDAPDEEGVAIGIGRWTGEIGERIDKDHAKRTVAKAVMRHCSRRIWPSLFETIDGWPAGDWIWRAYEGWRAGLDKAKAPGPYLAACIRGASEKRRTA